MIVKHTSSFGKDYLFHLDSKDKRSWAVRIDNSQIDKLYRQTRDRYGQCSETYTPILPLAFIQGF